MQSLSNHKRATVKEKIETVGKTLRFLPHYSSDFIPIEKAFSRLKAMLPNAGERTVRAVGSNRQPSRHLPSRRMHELLQILRL
jgi:transposase